MPTVRTIETVDSHTEGNPTRVIVGGVDLPSGLTLWQIKDYLETECDQVRRLLNFEPRGGGLMCSVLLLDPLQPEADFSIIIMEQAEYVPMCGHCAIGTATTIVAQKLVEVVEPYTEVVLDTLAGLVKTRVKVVNGEPVEVTLTNVESFILLQNQTVQVEGVGAITLDVGYGGDFYPIVDADALGLPLDVSHEPEIVSLSKKIRAAVQRDLATVHPEQPQINTCYQVQFISQKTTNGGHLRNTVVAPPGAMDRSPCGTGTCLLTTRAVAKGLIQPGDEYIVEGPLGTSFRGRIVSSEERDGVTYYRPQVTGRAFITGYNKWVLDERDPFPNGFQVGVKQ